MIEPTIAINMTCELKDEKMEDLVTKNRLINITVIDRNDNHIYVDEESEIVTMFRHDLEFFEVRSQLFCFNHTSTSNRIS